jgi:protein-disulfide isomerase
VTIPTARLVPLAAAAAVAFVSACSGDAGRESADPGGTSDVGAALLSTDPEEPAMSTNPELQRPSPMGPAPDIPVSDLGHNSGSPDALIKIIEFSDFGCGFCRQFHAEVFPVLEENYIETGKVEWKYVPMILGIFGENAEVAAQVGECAMAQDRFPAVRDRLFEDQPAWQRASDPMPVFRRIAEEEGLDAQRLVTCVRSDANMGRIMAGTQVAQVLGTRGTPSFFVVGEGPIQGVIPVELFSEILDTLYAFRMRADTAR